MNKAENITKLFGMTTQLICTDLSNVEERFAIQLGHLPKEDVKESEYYPQFEHNVRKEAEKMAAYYEVFYCLEKSIRRLIAEEMADDPEDWWASGKIPENTNLEVKKRMKDEIEAGVTPRSTDKLDYTNFGDLSGIIAKNWEVFESVFTNQKAVQRVLWSLNTLRGPIAHCCAFSDDEALRLRIAVRDWFRIMGGNKGIESEKS